MSWPADKPTSDGLTQVASGESLLVNQYICSPGDKARLMLEENGNLTIFKLKGKPHTINKRGKTLGVQLSNQEDGNLVLYDADGKPANWASNTKASEGEGPSLLTVSDEGRAIYAGPDGTVLWTSDGKGVGSKVEAAAKEPEEKPPMVEGGEAPPASVEKESTGVVQMASIAASGGVSDSTPIEFIAEVKDQWERDGRTMSKIEVYIVNKGQHNIMSLDVVVPEREVVYESWGAAHDQGEDSGRRIFSLPDFIKERGGITAGECYNFGGVFSKSDPGFLVENFSAPS